MTREAAMRLTHARRSGPAQRLNRRTAAAAPIRAIHAPPDPGTLGTNATGSIYIEQERKRQLAEIERRKVDLGLSIRSCVIAA